MVLVRPVLMAMFSLVMDVMGCFLVKLDSMLLNISRVSVCDL